MNFAILGIITLTSFWVSRIIKYKKMDREFIRMQREFYEKVKCKDFRNKVVQNPDSESASILELSETFTREDVDRQYRKLSLKHHPDKGGNPELFLSLALAREKLLDGF